ncbi:S-adenosyl-L-methionine-dependent methyltransferase [Dichotomocladium elegans]|nr:S-adenosyl-L-methionine-dependent methyltransferase [Dichotomocladium elegans]
MPRAQARPSFPPACLDELQKLVPPGPSVAVLDLGAGTGKMTEQLYAAGYAGSLTAVEPVEAMLDQLRQKQLPGVKALQGTSWSIPVESKSQDMVVVAQAFHWFDDLESLREMHRVLKPGGYLVLIWNMASKERSRWVKALRERYEIYQNTPKYASNQWRQIFSAPETQALFSTPLRQKIFANDHITTPAQIGQYVMTNSYIAVLPDTTKAALAKDVEAILADPANEFKVREDGTVIHPYDTDMVWTRARTPSD